MSSRGDMDALEQLFAPNAIWHDPGRGPLAGVYEGWEQILAHLGNYMQLSNGTFRIAELHDVVASDDHVVSLPVIAGERGEETGGAGHARLPHPRHQNRRGMGLLRVSVRGRRILVVMPSLVKSLSPQAEEAWAERIDELSAGRIRTQTEYWLVGANIPGKARALLSARDSGPVMRVKRAEVAANGYEGILLQ